MVSRLAVCENLPERCYEGGLHPVEEGLHAIEHGDEGKEAWVYQQVATADSTAEGNQSRTIGGLKPWLFWFILIVVSLVVIGASVGGAAGGSLAAKDSSSSDSSSSVQRHASPAEGYLVDMLY
jgi:hypothetical protein